MTSTATCTVQAVDTYAAPSTFSSPYTYSAHQSLRSASPRTTSASHVRTGSSGNVTRPLKRNTSSREDTKMSQEQGGGASTSASGGDRASDASGWASLSTHSSTWLKRLSSFSQDSSQPSSPGPDSAFVSHSNASGTFSHTGSTTPMFPTSTPPLPPNKLVKRSSSVKSTNSSPFLPLSGSKLPIPVFRRPATSHQRSATLQESRLKSEISGVNTPSPGSRVHADEAQWRNYFTPRVAADRVGNMRRNSTGIPNPIKRVYPDRKYTPTLISAGQPIAFSRVELDDDDGDDDARARLPQGSKVVTPFFPSPLPARAFASASTIPVSSERLVRSRRETVSGVVRSSVGKVKGMVGGKQPGQGIAGQEGRRKEGSDVESKEEEPLTRSSFSFSDLLSEPRMWKRPSSTRVPDSKYRPRGGRSLSGPVPSMGNRLSSGSRDGERPAKRRETTAPPLPSYTLQPSHTDASPTPSGALHELGPTLQSPAPVLTPSPFENTSTVPAQQRDVPISSIDPSTFPSPISSARQSVSISEIASTLGSDSEVRSGTDDGLDSQSETVYDSLQTRATRSSSGKRGPAIETIFDESPPHYVHSKPTMLKDFLQQSSLYGQENIGRPRHSIIEEEESVASTPARSFRHDSSNRSSPAAQMTKSLQQSTIPSSPPDVPTLVKLSTPGPTNGSDDDQESSWSFGEDDDEPTNQLPLRARFPHLDVSGDMLSPYSKAQGSSSVTATPQRNGDKDARSSIFDWSEQLSFDKSPGNRSPPRPKTVHGKKDAENRGSRSVGRRAPSGIHARSQSVPSAPEVDGKKNVVTNKFGTWGVGSKGVTEDWNEDFDFEEPQVPVPVMGPGGEKRLDSGVMFVPKSIQEQQTNVLANITLLRDWGLLIEELKELRTRAAALNLLDGPNEKTWDEVDAMIDLADQESDDITLDPRYTPPSSPTFDFDEFEEALSGISPRPRPKLPETVPEEAALPGPHPVYTHGETDLPRTVTTPTRPRKDSEAVAKLVIAALQQKRNVPESTNGSKADQPAKKVPFDTATLRRIVPYVQELRDKIKKTIREAEGLYSSPSYRNRSAEDPSFSKIFREPPESPSVRRASRRSTPAFDRTRSDESFTSTNDDLAGRMKLMTVS